VSEFEGTCVLVTGCGRVRGIGRAVSVAFARAGADVVATDIATGGTRNENEEGLEEIRLGWTGLESLAKEIEGLGRRIVTLEGDVSHAADAERFVKEALPRFGRIDVLVNNAAAPHGADRRLLWEVPEEVGSRHRRQSQGHVLDEPRGDSAHAVAPQRPHRQYGVDLGKRGTPAAAPTPRRSSG
jgi:NAD(P)-dependent dehydrogenase (short-subunit alcohol dehydrogenase family)